MENDLKLTMYEQETVINFNREDKLASVYTCEPSLKTRLAKMAKENKDVKFESDNGYGVTYTLPKGLVSIRSKFVKPNLTDEQRKARSERMSKILRTGHRKKTANISE